MERNYEELQGFGFELGFGFGFELGLGLGLELEKNNLCKRKCLF